MNISHTLQIASNLVKHHVKLFPDEWDVAQFVLACNDEDLTKLLKVSSSSKVPLHNLYISTLVKRWKNGEMDSKQLQQRNNPCNNK